MNPATEPWAPGVTKRPNATRRNLNLLKIAGALAIGLASIWWYSGTGHASVVQIRIYSSLEPASGLYDYGMHFDESNVAFGARDWNFTTDGPSDDVYLRLNLYYTQTYYVRYHIFQTPGNPCAMSAKLQQYIGGTWIEIGGTELHFEHQTQISEAWTNSIKNSGETIGWDVGAERLCNTYEWHSHASADVGTTGLMTFAPQSNDTCWTNLEYAFQCPGTYPDHQTCSTWFGTASISGNKTEYECNTWSNRARSTTYPAFYVWY